MNTPTPRTDKLSVSLLRKTFLTSYVAMKEHACTLERELTHAREINAGSEANVAFLREELERERAKVRTLREACERLRVCDWVITLPDRMDAVRDIARAALDATEDNQ